MRPHLRSRRRYSAAPGAQAGRTIIYNGWEVMPEVERVADGELFGGTWVIRGCSLGRGTRQGYEVRSLLADNGHHATRREAVHAAFLRAMRTIELGEVGAVHLSSLPTRPLDLSVE